MDYCNKCGGDPDEVGELTEWRTMNVCKSCLVNEPDYALFLEEVNEAIRATTAELERVRGMLQYAGTTAHIRSCHCEECSKIRAYLAETEARDA